MADVYVFDGKGGAQKIDVAEVQDWKPKKGCLWVHLDYSDEEEQHWLTNTTELELKPLVIEALLADETRPRTAAIDDGLLMSLRGVNHNPGADPEDMVSIRLWVEKHRIFSTRRRALLSVADVVAQLESKRGPSDSSQFVIDLIDRLVTRMCDIVDELDDKTIAFEELIVQPNRSGSRLDLADLRRQAISLRRYLAPQREALSRLFVEKISWFSDTSRLHIREVSDQLMRHLEDIESIRDRTKDIQEEMQNRISEQINMRIYVLSIISAIFIPLGFLTGLLGINIGGIPGAESPLAFWLFLGILAVLVGGQIMWLRSMKCL